MFFFSGTKIKNYFCKKNIMKSFVIFFTLLMASGMLWSQETQDPKNMKVQMNQEAHYPEGDNEMFMYIFRNVQYPENITNKPVHGNVTLSFNVETDSTLTGFVVISGVGQGIDEAIIEAMKKMKFAPSVQNGTKVKMNMMLSIPVYIRE